MKRIAGVMAGLLACVGLLLGAADIAQASHSSRGCFNCHVPHQANPVSATDYGVPLWSPKYANGPLHVTYTMYSSPTFDALSPEISSQPDGASKLCLGCHDGSYSSVRNPRRIFGAGSLATSHPISFKYTAAMASAHPALKSPTEMSGMGGTIAQDLLDSQGKMQCTSCHDVHSSGYGDYMLRWDGITGDPLSGTTLADGTANTFVKGSELPMCKTCHNK
jgi:predicted CXXCH cytochrome family protein